MTEGELRQIITGCEADRVEFTTSTSDVDKWSQAVCAFANDLPNHREPGYLLLGVADDGRIAGIEVQDELLTRLGNLRGNGQIQPLPSLTIEKVSTSDGDVAAGALSRPRLRPIGSEKRFRDATGREDP